MQVIVIKSIQGSMATDGLIDAEMALLTYRLHTAHKFTEMDLRTGSSMAHLTCNNWGCALGWFLWLPLGCYNSHFEGLGLENAMGAMNICVAFIDGFYSRKGRGSPERNPFRAMTALKGIPSGPYSDS